MVSWRPFTWTSSTRIRFGAAARDVTARLGGFGLDALFNNAGMGDVFPTEYASLDALRKI